MRDDNSTENVFINILRRLLAGGDSSLLTLKIYMEINTTSDVEVFQSGIDCIADWANKWQLKLASAKCQLIRVGLLVSVNVMVFIH